METWQSKWEPPRPVHHNPCLVEGKVPAEALREAFAQHGEVAEVFAPKGQDFAFVTFADKYDAGAAIQALNGQAIGGAPVKVSDGKCANAKVAAWRRELLRTAKA